MPNLVKGNDMSRVGVKPIDIPQEAKVSLSGSQMVVKGPKGELELNIRPEVEAAVADGKVVVKIKKQDKLSRSLHGLTRSLIANILVGVTEGFEKRLVLVGTGYRAHPEGKDLRFSLGFSHDIEFKAPAGIELKTEGQDKVIVSGIDKQLVGQTAANIRDLRKPEPYKGKGIRYENEVVRRKVGKQAKAAE